MEDLSKSTFSTDEDGSIERSLFSPPAITIKSPNVAMPNAFRGTVIE